MQILLDDRELPGPRNAAAIALGKIGAQEAGDPLIKVLKNKNNEKHVRGEQPLPGGCSRTKRQLNR